jgi:hypothetical protein
VKNSLFVLGALLFGLVACGPGVSVSGGQSAANNPIDTDLGANNDANIVTPGDGDPNTCGDVELHVVGIYDPYSPVTGQQGPATVHIDRPGSVVLFLSAYSATDWTVTAGPNTDLVSVIAHGYDAQTVTAPPGVPTTALSYQANGQFLGCGYEYPDTDPHSGCETPELLAEITKLTALPVSSFHGCYAAADFQINADLSSSSTCSTEMGYAHTSLVATPCTTPPDPSDPCAGKAGGGHYEGFFCEPEQYPSGGPFIITEGITCEEALANCKLNGENNPGWSIQCTWDGDIIHTDEQVAGACGP